MPLALPLPVTVKRKIRRWVRETEPYCTQHGAELQISDALVVRWSPEVSATVHAAERYARLREQWIETNPDIKGGEPVIRDTRIGVRAVAQRIAHGDSLQTLIEDYPHIPVEAFQTACTYASGLISSCPRPRGRSGSNFSASRWSTSNNRRRCAPPGPGRVHDQPHRRDHLLWLGR